MSLFSMNWIRLRCRCDEDTGCQLWLGGVSESGAPVATKRTPDGRKPTFQMRREVWEHRHGPIPQGMVVTVSCKHKRCLAHLELITKSEVVRRQWQETATRAKLTASAAKASRARTDMTMEKAREIRESPETLEQVAARLGTSMSTASLIRRGIRWKEPNSPFAGLGAR